MKNNNDRFSVIIRTKNEERWIGHAIQSILNNIKKPEIIIVDNNSIDKTLDIVRMFKQDPLLENNKNNLNYTNINVYQINYYTPGKALNYGVKKCKNNNIILMSAHCVLKKIDLLKAEKDLKNYSAIFGNQIPIYMGKKITKRYLWSHFGSKSVENMFSKLENRYFLHNAFSIFQKKILKKFPFDENLAGKEDRYWVNKIVKKGHKFLYDAKIIVDHHYTENGNTWKGIG